MAIFERGTQIGDYVLGQRIGRGRFAEVYEATAPDGTQKAVKVLTVDVALGAEAQARFVQECGAVAIEHTHIVSYHGAGFAWGRPYLVTELVRGPNLRELVRAEGLLSIERAVSIVQQVASGVAAAHLLGIVHRDLKPESIVLGPGDLVKVTGFGSAYVGEWGSEQHLVCGLFRSPESLMRNSKAPSNDVYALGVLLYMLCVGEHPLMPTPVPLHELIRRHLTMPAPLLETRSTDARPIPGDVSYWCARAMTKDPAVRCTMREFADGLAVALSRLRAPRRAEARNMMPAANVAALARTEQAMAASGPSGTMVMPAAGAAPAAGTRVDVDTHTALPKEPPLQSPPTPWVARPLAPVDAPGERRSTPAPVERPAPAPHPRLRAPPAAIALTGAAVVLGLSGAGWRLLGSGTGVAARAPPTVDAAPPPAAVSATATPSAAGSVQAPPVETSAVRPRAAPLPARPRAPPPQRARLPFQ